MIEDIKARDVLPNQCLCDECKGTKEHEQMTQSSKEEIERVAREIHLIACHYDYPHTTCTVKAGEYDSDEIRLAQWHLQKMQEQKARYEKLVKASRYALFNHALCVQLHAKDCVIPKLREALSDLESEPK